VEPYDVVVPYLNETVEIEPFGLTDPFNVAVVCVMLVAPLGVVASVLVGVVAIICYLGDVAIYST
jgi:hypothetical protein